MSIIVSLIIFGMTLHCPYYSYTYLYTLAITTSHTLHHHHHHHFLSLFMSGNTVSGDWDSKLEGFPVGGRGKRGEKVEWRPCEGGCRYYMYMFHIPSIKFFIHEIKEKQVIIFVLKSNICTYMHNHKLICNKTHTNHSPCGISMFCREMIY